MQGLTLEAVLDLPLLRQSGAQAVAFTDGLDCGVRWLHTSELADVAPLLREGDMELTTGSGLPGGDDRAGFE